MINNYDKNYNIHSHPHTLFKTRYPYQIFPGNFWRIYQSLCTDKKIDIWNYTTVINLRMRRIFCLTKLRLALHFVRAEICNSDSTTTLFRTYKNEEEALWLPEYVPLNNEKRQPQVLSRILNEIVARLSRIELFILETFPTPISHPFPAGVTSKDNTIFKEEAHSIATPRFSSLLKAQSA